MTPYLRIARIDHWFKNVFMLPGVVIALTAQPSLLSGELVYLLILGFLAAGMVASSNYVLNEIVDAPYDALHPVKKQRPIPSGEVNLLLGWYAIGSTLVVPVSLVIAYWMLGAFFMAIKRFGEYRLIDNPRWPGNTGARSPATTRRSCCSASFITAWLSGCSSACSCSATGWS